GAGGVRGAAPGPAAAWELPPAATGEAFSNVARWPGTSCGDSDQADHRPRTTGPAAAPGHAGPGAVAYASAGRAVRGPAAWGDGDLRDLQPGEIWPTAHRGLLLQRGRR